jgi:hypothetical protein
MPKLWRAALLESRAEVMYGALTRTEQPLWNRVCLEQPRRRARTYGRRVLPAKPIA